MDFAAALAKLETTAAHVASGSEHSGAVESDSRRRRRPDNQQSGGDSYYGGRPLQRMKHDDFQRRGHSNSLEELVRRGYRIRPPLVEAESCTDTKFKHLCLLMLCIDSVPYFDIWKAFANPENGDTSTIVSLVIHAKYPNPLSRSDDIQRHILLHPPRPGRGNSFADPEYFTLAPNWGSLQLTEAMICLLRQGMEIGHDNYQLDERFATRRFLLSKNVAALDRIPPADHFVFVSESCLPVRTLRECSDLIWGSVDASKGDHGNEQGSRQISLADLNDASGLGHVSRTNGAISLTPSIQTRQSITSWVCARKLSTPGAPRNKYESDQFRNVNRMIPESYIWKADQWLLLSRPHAASVLQVDAHMRPSDQLLRSFSKVSASDEIYFPTVLAVLGILRDKETASDILTRQVTFVDWSEGMRNPASFEHGIRDLQRIAKLARGQGCLFARKFVLRHPGREHITGNIDPNDWRLLMNELVDNGNSKSSEKEYNTSTTID